VPATLKSRLNASRGRRDGSGEARRVSKVAGNSQKPSQRPRKSEKGFRGSRHLSKAVSIPRGAAETAPEKREGFPRKGFRRSRHLSKATSTPPRGRRNGSGEARRVSEVAGNSQKPPLRPLGPPKRLRRSEKVSQCGRHLSKAASTPPGAASSSDQIMQLKFSWFSYIHYLKFPIPIGKALGQYHLITKSLSQVH